MDATALTWIFFLGGLLLMLLETVLPGGVAFFLGFGGLAVAGLRLFGIFTDPFTAVFAWLLLSTGLTVALRPFAMRYFGGDVSLALTDEDAEALGEKVTVVEPVGAETPGRIRFRGAEWDARTVEGALPKGAKAKILYRDNLTWVVEPIDDSDLDQELAAHLREQPDDDSSGVSYDPSAQRASS
jgi:membrane protein implicated in regulation of membrane protease activity